MISPNLHPPKKNLLLLLSAANVVLHGQAASTLEFARQSPRTKLASSIAHTADKRGKKGKGRQRDPMGKATRAATQRPRYSKYIGLQGSQSGVRRARERLPSRLVCSPVDPPSAVRRHAIASTKGGRVDCYDVRGTAPRQCAR